MKKLIIYFVFILSSSFLHAQKEANIWYFGLYAGLDFNSGHPVALNDGKLTTVEGCATISDSDGNLLFYTDGRKVWDKSHLLMPNGVGLFGDSSSTQSAIIVPNPVDSDLYYIFTVDDGGNDKGLRYSLVDMDLHGGLGDIDINEKNIELISPVSEKVTAVKSADDSRIFVFTYRGGNFYTFEVNETGVNRTPIHISSGNFIEHSEGRGYLKASPDGEKLALAHEQNRKVFLFSLNPVTGEVSDEKEMFLNDSSHPNNATNTLPYGIEFSPDSGVLYVSSANEDAKTVMSDNKSYLWQFDLSDPHPENKAMLIHFQEGKCRGALQLASDFKIYHALSNSYGQGYNKLSVIENPNAIGVDECQYNYASIDLGENLSRQGLPPFIQSFFNVFINAENTCLGYPTSFSLVDYEGISSYTWDFGDGTSENGNFSPTSHTYLNTGIYLITVTAQTNSGEKIRKKYIQILEPFADEIQDVSSCDSYVLPGLSNNRQNYFSEPEGNGEMLFANQEIFESQTIYIYSETGTSPNCTDEHSFTITINDSPVLEEVNDIVSEDEYILPPLSLGNYFTESGGNGLQLSEGDSIKNSQTIYIYAQTGDEPDICFDEKSFNVTINQSTQIEYMNFFTPNGDGYNDFWTIKNIPLLSHTKIMIFNRYGKLVAMIEKGKGWDGTYNGIKMPSSEYWFRASLENGEEVKGHFSLIRK